MVAWLRRLWRSDTESAPQPQPEPPPQEELPGLDVPFLAALGQLWNPQDQMADWVPDPEQEAWAQRLADRIQAAPSRPLVLTGEAGSGKSVILEALASRLTRQGWIVLVAGPRNFYEMAGSADELERLVSSLLRQLQAHPQILWICPSFPGLLFFGPQSILDLIWPALSSGQIGLVAESAVQGYENLLHYRPQVCTLMSRFVLPPMATPAAVALADRWRQTSARRPFWQAVTAPDLQEIALLCDHYVPGRVQPGSLLDFLKEAEEEARARGEETLNRAGLMVHLANRTGIPQPILDDGDRLDLGAVRAFFQSRVVGQPDAVELMVQRIALLKAGLVDPDRPIGVFLFIGPTGTGKTELARSVAQYLFGSEERLIRLDMSEYEARHTIARIMGEPGDVSDTGTLAARVRRSPFSVILLDEFEKAAPNIWDLFLQVFDEGRLTNAMGETVDFRRTILIMTSNLGSAVPVGTRMGFTGEPATFSTREVERELARTFAPEFINRIDSVVNFHPLSRGSVREILLKELNRVLQRRGLRHRQWAVEWEEPALEFLMAEGFSPQLGARPMRRAIEQHLLTPLAMAIVEHRFPEGDQFLFVRHSRQGLRVDFVDPDLPPDTEGEVGGASVPVEGGEGISLAQTALTPLGSAAEYGSLVRALTDLEEAVSQPAWQKRKQAGLAEMASPDFWEREERFALLGDIEYQDRFEVSLESTRSLLRRMGQAPSGERRLSAEMARQIALRLFLMQRSLAAFEAGRPQDAFVGIDLEPVSSQDHPQDADAFARRLTAMYESWAEERKMTWERLTPRGDGRDGTYRALLTVSGFAAFAVLAGEHGLHVWEIPDGPSRFRRISVRVMVVPQPDAPPHSESVLAQARRALDAADAGNLTIVRRYREQPSPLVRDGVAGWRSGRLDRVLAGDFDLMGRDRSAPDRSD